MIIFPQEQADGIAELVQAKAYVNYDMPILTAEMKDFDAEILKSAAKLNFSRPDDTFDLHPINSVLVSMGWNKNDDVFTKEQAYPARYSPTDKPFNFMHVQSDIIGHITDSIVVDQSFARIEDSVDPTFIPDKFHIITAGVIYKIWEDPKLQQRMDKIISEIKEGDKWFVSMECLFAGFDYGIIKANGESAVIERNEQTSALTKYLRAYGGPGIYNGHKIGRVLKKITFSGKGLVNNPANPESVILNNFNSSYANLGYVNNMNQNGENIMTDTIEILKAEVKDLKEKLVAKEVSATEALNKSHATEVASLTKQISDLVAAEEKDKEDKKKFWEDKDKEKAEVEKLKADNEYMSKVITEFKKASKKTERETALLKKGVAAEEVESLVANTLDTSDEQFAGVVATFEAFAKKVKKDKEDGATSPPMPSPGSGVQPNFAAEKDAKDKDAKDAKDMKDCEAGTKEVTTDPVDVITTASVVGNQQNLGVSISNQDTEVAQAIAKFYKSFKGETE